MNLAHYRKEFAAYNSAVYAAQYRYRGGFERELDTRAIYERYGDLFALGAIEELRKARNGVPEGLQTERRALHLLIGASSIGYLESQARELIEECALREAASYFELDGERISVYVAPKLIAFEQEPNRRQKLTALWASAIASSNDVRAARFESYYASARTLGASSYGDLLSTISGTNYTQLLASAEAFLHRTESVYRGALAHAAASYLSNASPGELDHGDFLRIRRMPWRDAQFSQDELMPTYYKAMNGLGIKAERQNNVHVDNEQRASKNPRAACFPIHIPDDIKFSVTPIGGMYDYTALFHEAGHAQHFAWTSRDLAESYPEFVYNPDYATTEGYAFLFQHLFLDPGWLVENCALRRADADAAVRDSSFLVMLTIRRYCAKLKFEIELHNSSNIRSDRHAADYALVQEHATGFRRSPDLYLWDVDDGFYSAAYLRAWTFEASLREYLRTRYGRRWWASPRAGDELIDLWNTASQYSVEELTRLIGFSDINFDLLADNLIAGVELH